MSAVMRHPFLPSIVVGDFSPEGKAKCAAGSAAFKRAIEFGYCRAVARALQRTAQREWIRGETPEHTARRIVQPQEGSSTQPPRGAA